MEDTIHTLKKRSFPFRHTLISALIMGQVISVGGTIYAPLAFVGPFIVMFVVILFRPTGLYGVKGKAFGFEE